MLHSLNRHTRRERKETGRHRWRGWEILFSATKVQMHSAMCDKWRRIRSTNQLTYVVSTLPGKVDDANRMFSDKHNLGRFPDQILSRVSPVNFDVLWTNFPKRSTSGNMVMRRKLTKHDINLDDLLRFLDQNDDATWMTNKKWVLNI